MMLRDINNLNKKRSLVFIIGCFITFVTFSIVKYFDKSVGADIPIITPLVLCVCVFPIHYLFNKYSWAPAIFVIPTFILFILKGIELINIHWALALSPFGLFVVSMMISSLFLINKTDEEHWGSNVRKISPRGNKKYRRPTFFIYILLEYCRLLFRSIRRIFRRVSRMDRLRKGFHKPKDNKKIIDRLYT